MIAGTRQYLHCFLLPVFDLGRKFKDVVVFYFLASFESLSVQLSFDSSDYSLVCCFTDLVKWVQNNLSFIYENTQELWACLGHSSSQDHHHSNSNFIKDQRNFAAKINSLSTSTVRWSTQLLHPDSWGSLHLAFMAPLELPSKEKSK